MQSPGEFGENSGVTCQEPPFRRLRGRRKHFLVIWILCAFLAPGYSGTTRAAETPEQLFQRFCVRREIPIMGCGTENLVRQTAQQLVRMGREALPAIQSELDLLEDDRHGSRCADQHAWILWAYSRIAGAEALPRLDRLSQNPKSPLTPALGIAYELAYGLTSYVRGSDTQWPRLSCYRAIDEPREALNAVVLGWLQQDRAGLESRLSPRAKAAFRRAASWDSLRKAFPLGRDVRSLAVGYRFDFPGEWSTPYESFERVPGHLTMVPELATARIDTGFRDKRGRPCGSFTAKFVRRVEGEYHTPIYYLDNTDIRALLKVVTGCALTDRHH